MLLWKTWCCFGIASLLESSLGSSAVLCLVFLQDFLKLPSPLLACSSSRTEHPFQFSICFFGQLSPPLMCQILTFFLTLYSSGFLLPTICLVLASSYLIFAVHPPFSSSCLCLCKERLTLLSSSCPPITPLSDSIRNVRNQRK